MIKSKWNEKKHIFIVLRNKTLTKHYLLASNIGGAFIVEPRFRFRKLSKRFVKFVDECDDDKSSLSCSPFVLDSIDALCKLLL